MARPPRPQNPPPSERRRFDPEEAAEAKDRLNRRTTKLLELVQSWAGQDYLSQANIALDSAKATVRDIFGDTSDESKAFVTALLALVPDTRVVGTRSDLDDENRRIAQERVHEAIRRVRNLVEIVDEKTVKASVAVVAPPTTTAPISRRVFLVHGHNEAVKQTVARALEKLDLQPIILHERPDKGRTIIEKIEDYADVGFAVILMTGDDVGGDKSATSPDSYRPRARQNVLLEMGFFLGCLGRGKVCVLYEAGVEIPSDYSGVLYKKLDDGDGWKLALAREINAAGIDVDVNRLL